MRQSVDRNESCEYRKKSAKTHASHVEHSTHERLSLSEPDSMGERERRTSEDELVGHWSTEKQERSLRRQAKKDSL